MQDALIFEALKALSDTVTLLADSHLHGIHGVSGDQIRRRLGDAKWAIGRIASGGRMEGLKPCPLCGFRSTAVTLIDPFRVRFQCPNPECRTAPEFTDSLLAAVDAWNRWDPAGPARSQELPAWDVVTNADFKTDCLLGFFRNHDVGDPSRLGESFGMLTAVKDPGLGDCRYEQSYGRRWRHFRAATLREVSDRIYGAE